jgi:tight adherence protein C
MLSIILITLCIFGSIGLMVIVYLRSRELKSESKQISKRLKFWLSEKSANLKYEDFQRDTEDKDESFAKQFLIPLGEQVGKWMSEKVPYHKQSTIRKQLIKAGFRDKKALQFFYSVKVALGILFAIGFTFTMSILGKEVQSGFLLGAICAFIGFRLPDILLDKKIAERQQQIDRVLPDALDLLVICTEAGMGIDQSLLRVAANIGTKGKSLREEIIITNREMNLGVERSECWTNMGERTNSEELKNLSRIIVQSEKVGASIAAVLRNQSEFLRMRRRQKAEETAAQMSVKMMLPLALFIFPCIMAVTMGPPVLKIISTFSGTAN